METSKIKISIENFRAIANADIVINGITVVAGENGSGKSTISKLLYYLYKTATNYENLVVKEVNIKLNGIVRFLEILNHEIYSNTKNRNIRNESREELYRLSQISNLTLSELNNKWNSILNRTEELYFGDPSVSNTSKNTFASILENYRLRKILQNVLDINRSEQISDDRIDFNKVKIYVNDVFKEAEEKIKYRPTNLFRHELIELFNQEILPNKFEVIEYNEEIISFDKKSLSIPFLIENVIYIDTPMMFGSESSYVDYWDDLHEKVAKQSRTNVSEISKFISDKIIHGEISKDDNSPFGDQYIFVREDGKVFDLLECATGIRSFGIIQLLLKNGSLNDKTLLIIDEPESHLHPQWIIEYANLIVLINKKLGVNFFIASHNPDMVSAIKHIVNKENLNEKLNFYLAEKLNGNYQYNYQSLSNDIDPIFKSFNIALERIHQYGSDNEVL